jgi:TRAP-type C4-dicarboxylate transport system permease large subunit
MIGIGITSLIIYVISIVILNVKLKRKMGEAMMWASLLLLIIGSVFGNKNFIASLVDSFNYAAKQEVVYAGLAFVFMAYVMDQTGVITRLVTILNSLLGRLPGGSGYAATIGTALFGMVSGVASASTAAVGSVTIPWMKDTGWSSERAATIVAGNGGLGNVLPPSSVMFLLLGYDNVSKELSAGELYIGLLSVGAFVVAFRLFLVFYFAKKDGVKAVPQEQIMPFSKAFKENGMSLIVFLGVIIPLLLTMGPTGAWIQSALSPVKGAFKSISLIFDIPLLITFFAIVEGWKYLPHSLSGWAKLTSSSIGKFNDLGALLVFAFVSSRLLAKLGLGKEFQAIFNSLNSYSPLIVMALICLVITAMVGPFNATGTTTALGAVSYAALRSVGLPPVVAAVCFINLVSNQSCVPPNSAPIYIACGIAEVNNPMKIFKTLLLYYAIPEVIIVFLVMLKIIPVYGG